MKPLFLVSVCALSLLCTACASHLGKGRAVATRADKTVDGMGASDASEPPGSLKVSPDPGTVTDNHSSLASRTPDGGMSASSGTLRPPMPGTPVPEGADTPADKATPGGTVATSKDAFETAKGAPGTTGGPDSTANPDDPEQPIDGSDLS